MIDTLHIHFFPRMFKSQKKFEDFGLKLRKQVLYMNGRTVFGQESFERLIFQGMTVDISKKRIKIHGSLWKFYKGDNVIDFWPHEVKPALQELSRLLGITVEKGVMSQVHIAQNFEVDDYSSHYIRELQPPRNMRWRDQFPGETAWYANKHNTLQVQVYDKKKEMMDEEDWTESQLPEHLIRYELRLQWEIAKLTGFCKNRVPVALLYSQSFHLKLLSLWYARFISLRWTSAPVYASIDGVYALKRFCIASFVAQAGGISAVCALIDSFDTKEGGNWKAKMRCDARDTLEAIMNDKSVTQQSTLSAELRTKVKKRYHLLQEYVSTDDPEILPPMRPIRIFNWRSGFFANAVPNTF